MINPGGNEEENRRTATGSYGDEASIGRQNILELKRLNFSQA